MPRRSAMPTMPMPIPWTEGATRSRGVSRFRLLLILAGMITAGAVIAWWLRHQHMSQLRLFALGGLVVTLLVWAGRHYRNGGRLVVKGIEWALVFSLAVTLTGATGVHPKPDAQQVQQMAQFVTCMRHHGIDLADPQVSPSGQLTIKTKGRTGPQPGDPKFTAAQRACRNHLPRDARQVTARENPAPANLQRSAAAYCRKLPACRDLLEWYSKRLGSESAKGGRPADKAKG